MASPSKTDGTLLLVSLDQQLGQVLAGRLAEQSWRLVIAENSSEASAAGRAHRPAAVFIDFHTAMTLAVPLLCNTPQKLTFGDWFELKRQVGALSDIRDELHMLFGESAACIALLQDLSVRAMLDALDAGFDAVVSRHLDQETFAGLLAGLSDRRTKDLRVVSIESMVVGRTREAHQIQPHSPLVLAQAEMLLTFCHDGQNAMAVINEYIQIIKMKLAERGSAVLVNEIDGLFGEIDRCLRSQIDTFHELHLAARALAGDSALRSPLSIVSLAELHCLIGSLLNSWPTASGVTLSCRVDGVAENLILPTSLAQQIFGPLVNNAIKAMGGHGELRVLVTAPPSPLDIEVDVEDSGPGWGERIEELRQAVEKWSFKSIGPYRPSRGFGLKLVRLILRQLGGGLVLETGHSGGAKVRVILPRRVFRE